MDKEKQLNKVRKVGWQMIERDRFKEYKNNVQYE